MNGLKASKIQIFNPLTGNVFLAKTTEWDKGKELIDYLLEKRTKLLERTKMLQQLQQKQMENVDKPGKLKVNTGVFDNDDHEEKHKPREYMFI